MRLVDVATGSILWEDQGDRRTGIPEEPTSLKPRAEEPPAEAPKPPSLAGKWRNSVGDEPEVTDDGANVIMTTINSPTALEFEARLIRTSPTSFRTVSSYILFKNETSRRRPTVTIRPIDADRFEMECTSYGVSGRSSRQLSAGPPVTYIFRKQ